MKINSKDFRVRPGEKIALGKWPTVVKPFFKLKKQYQKLLEEHVEELSSLQRLHYASNRYALLLIFQAMDAAGKDGGIRHVMSGVNPQGCKVVSFKHPSADELEHDFLWRTTCQLPERGRIGIFNRSYYEEVLVVRVHPEILLSQGLPAELRDEKSIWEDRCRSIVDLESHLFRNGTRTVKIFLHLSKEEQRKRFLDRIDEPDKNWKFSLADIHERKYWTNYMKAYEACLNATSTHHAPWYVVPADDKENARLIVSQIVLDALHELKNKSRLVLLPWVHIQNLASATLARALRHLPVDWRAQYGVTPLLVETLVDPARYTGGCYRAANWVEIGETSGRGRDDRQHRRHGSRPKRVFVYPLRRDARARVRGENGRP